MRIVVGVGGLPFQEELVLSVAVHIGHRGVVGAVGHGHSARHAVPARVGCGPPAAATATLPRPCLSAVGGDGRREWDSQKAVGGGGRHRPRAAAAAAAHLVGGRDGQRMAVDEECPAPSERPGREAHAVAVHVERLGGTVAGQRAPGHHHLRTVAQGHHATVEPLGDHAGAVVARLGHGGSGTQGKGRQPQKEQATRTGRPARSIAKGMAE